MNQKEDSFVVFAIIGAHTNSFNQSIRAAKWVLLKTRVWLFVYKLAQIRPNRTIPNQAGHQINMVPKT